MPSSIILLLIQMAKNICWKNMWILLIAYRVYIGFRRLLSSYCLSWKMIMWDCVITFQKLIFCHLKLSAVCNGKILTSLQPKNLDLSSAHLLYWILFIGYHIFLSVLHFVLTRYYLLMHWHIYKKGSHMTFNLQSLIYILKCKLAWTSKSIDSVTSV